MNGQTDVSTDFPCILHDIVPFEAAAQKGMSIPSIWLIFILFSSFSVSSNSHRYLEFLHRHNSVHRFHILALFSAILPLRVGRGECARVNL